MAKAKIKAIDFFCSGGGMTYGLTKAGINVVAGVDIDPACRETYERNNPKSKFIQADIKTLKETSLQRALRLKKSDDNLMLIGCSPCQFWSVIQTDKSKAAKSKSLLAEFQRFVAYFKPGYVLVENVPGILSKRKESGLAKLLSELDRLGYWTRYEIVDMNDYGVPQSRRRFSLVATRLHESGIFPKKKRGRKPVLGDAIGVHNGFRPVAVGHRDSTASEHSTAVLSEVNLKRLKRTPTDGGSWLSWANDPKLKRKMYTGRGFVDNYGRMAWKKPAPTITTKFTSISNGRFAHPEEHRGISVREGATLQTFPRRYVFHSNGITASAKLIGNAVPPEFARRLGQCIVKAHYGKGHTR